MSGEDTTGGIPGETRSCHAVTHALVTRESRQQSRSPRPDPTRPVLSLSAHLRFGRGDQGQIVTYVPRERRDGLALGC